LRMAEKGDFNVKDEVEGEKGEPDSKNRPGSVDDDTTEELEGIDDDLKNKSDAKSNGKVKDDDDNEEEEEEEEAEKPAIVFL